MNVANGDQTPVNLEKKDTLFGQNLLSQIESHVQTNKVRYDPKEVKQLLDASLIEQ